MKLILYIVFLVFIIGALVLAILYRMQGPPEND